MAVGISTGTFWERTALTGPVSRFFFLERLDESRKVGMAGMETGKRETGKTEGIFFVQVLASC